jgi:hypothetical protein
VASAVTLAAYPIRRAHTLRVLPRATAALGDDGPSRAGVWSKTSA